MKRVEKHKIKKDNKYFPFILEQLEQCKKISNSATFIIRQNFFFNKTKDSKGNVVRKYIKYNDMDRIFKRDRTELYRSLIYAQSVQQILRKVQSSFDSFFKAIKDYMKNKSNYTGRPKLPKYKSSKYDELIITNQNFKQNDKVLNFKGYLKELSFTMYNNGKANQVMFKYNGVDIDVYIIYDDGKALINKEVVDYIDDDSRIISIDLGLNNLVTITNNKSISDVSWSEFIRQLEYKANWYGRKVVRVPTFYPSSKTCSSCGTVKETLKLSERIYKCECCGLEIDRDYNASINILRKGLEMLKIS